MSENCLILFGITFLVKSRFFFFVFLCDFEEQYEPLILLAFELPTPERFRYDRSSVFPILN